jgi:hypothetical protein
MLNNEEMDGLIKRLRGNDDPVAITTEGEDWHRGRACGKEWALTSASLTELRDSSRVLQDYGRQGLADRLLRSGMIRGRESDEYAVGFCRALIAIYDDVRGFVIG